MTGPGLDFFRTIEKQSGRLPIIAEDLGLITPQVEKLLQQTGFPGMRFLQFAFSGIEIPTSNDLDTVVVDPHHLPHNFHPNTVVYTGTHDNQTTKDWFRDLSKQEQKYILDYCNSNGEDVVGDLMRLAWSSVANYAIIPLQDILRLGDDARMNYPGKIGHNWEWRFTWNQLKKDKGLELKKLSRLYNRF